MSVKHCKPPSALAIHNQSNSITSNQTNPANQSNPANQIQPNLNPRPCFNQSNHLTLSVKLCATVSPCQATDSTAHATPNQTPPQYRKYVLNSESFGRPTARFSTSMIILETAGLSCSLGSCSFWPTRWFRIIIGSQNNLSGKDLTCGNTKRDAHKSQTSIFSILIISNSRPMHN